MTLRAVVMLTVHGPVPAQAPLQPAKVAPAAGVAVRVTVLPDAMLALQVLPQSMPLGEDVTVPVALPTFATVRVYVVWTGCVPNVAVTLRAAVMLTVHGPVPVQAPLQPANVEPVPAAAVRVTAVPAA